MFTLVEIMMDRMATYLLYTWYVLTTDSLETRNLVILSISKLLTLVIQRLALSYLRVNSDLTFPIFKILINVRGSHFFQKLNT